MAAVLVAASCPAAVARGQVAGAPAPAILRSFNGDKGPGVAECMTGLTRCGRQPEPNVASNGTRVVQVTWQTVGVYDDRGKRLQATPFRTFIRNAGLDPIPRKGANGAKGPYEPHVVYDEFIGRWIVTSACLNDCLMVSASSDPMGPWGGVYLTCAGGGPCLDYDSATKVGYDRNGVYYCGAHGGEDNPATVHGAAYDCFALPPDEVKAIATGKVPAHLNRVHNMPLDVVPAIDNNPRKTPDAPAFFLNKSCDHHSEPGACQRSINFPFEWVVNTFTWNGTTGTYNAGGAQQLVKTNVGSTASQWLYNTPCCGQFQSVPQAGSDVTLRAATSHRVMNVMQAGSHLYAVLGSGPCSRDCGLHGTDAHNVMIYVDLDCSKPSACVVSQTAKISGGDLIPEFGTVGVDPQGNVGIVAATTSATTNLSIMLWSRNTFSGPLTIVKGTLPCTCTATQMGPGAQNTTYTLMGNAVGIVTTRDPLDGTKLWTTQHWSNDATPCVFNTRIIQCQLAPPAAGKESPKR